MKLDPQQTAAVNSEHKNIMVIAGPGSGKTSVLVERAFSLSRAGETGIVIVTFTNAAAGEVIRRLKDAHSGDANTHGGTLPPGIFHVGTLHAFMLGLIVEHADAIRYPKEIAVLDHEQSRAVMDDAIAAQRYRGTLRSVKEAIARGPLHFFKHAPAAANDNVWSGEELVAAEYHRRMREGGMLDYDSILELGMAVLKKKGCACKHLLVDEWQDTGIMDWKIYSAIGSTTRFYVGDPNQAIFGFRHREQPGVLFHYGLPWKEYFLQLNYRSSVAVCNAASRLIAHNTKAMASVSSSGKAGLVKTYAFATELAELAHVVDWFNQRENEWNGSAVLVRTNWMAERFANALRESGVRVSERLALKRPIDWREAKDAVAFLANPDNDMLAHRVLTRTIGRTSADSKRLQASKEFTTINRITFNIKRMVVSSEIVRWLQGLQVSEDSITVINRLLADNETLTMAADVSLALAVEDTTETGPGVTVTTYHKAKGCEFNTVLLPAFNEGIIPYRSDEIEEERRVAFVGITRALNEVHISHALSRGQQWKREAVKHEPSRFLQEMEL